MHTQTSPSGRSRIVEMKVDRWFHDGRGEFPVETEFYVYNVGRLIRVCPSIGMAREVAASLEV
jgi:hypothetical protein